MRTVISYRKKVDNPAWNADEIVYLGSYLHALININLSPISHGYFTLLFIENNSKVLIG